MKYNKVQSYLFISFPLEISNVILLECTCYANTLRKTTRYTKLNGYSWYICDSKLGFATTVFKRNLSWRSWIAFRINFVFVLVNMSTFTKEKQICFRIKLWNKWTCWSNKTVEPFVKECFYHQVWGILIQRVEVGNVG